jgi:hypothetical protein
MELFGAAWLTPPSVALKGGPVVLDVDGPVPLAAPPGLMGCVAFVPGEGLLALAPGALVLASGPEVALED